MRIVTFVTADAAVRDPNSGKVSLLGLFRQIYVAQFPSVRKRIALFIVVESDGPEDVGPHQIRIAWTDDDAEMSHAVEGTIGIGKDAHGVPHQHEVNFDIDEMVLQKEGQIRFDVSLDGELAGSTVISVVSIGAK